MLAALVSNGGESQKKKQKYLLQSFFLLFIPHRVALARRNSTQNCSCWCRCEKFPIPCFLSLNRLLLVGQWRDTCVLTAVMAVTHLVDKLNFLYWSLSKQSEFRAAFLLHARLLRRSVLLSQPFRGNTDQRFQVLILNHFLEPKGVQRKKESRVLESWDICRHLEMSEFSFVHFSTRES